MKKTKTYCLSYILLGIIRLSINKKSLITISITKFVHIIEVYLLKYYF